jgi:hypothetical protein
MSLLKVNFQELYQRHLCRHSQWGINVIHLATVIASYLAIFGILAKLVEPEWILLAVPVLYFSALAFNIPLRVLVTSLIFVVLFFVLFFSLPESTTMGLSASTTFLLYLLIIVLSHQVQNWSHKLFPIARDMSEYDQKYKKGPALFVLLSLYELPILLNYLVFDKKSWAA